MGSFGALKMIMPLIRPFSWDASLASADRALFFGVDPWRITHALFGGPKATRIIDTLYTAWVPFVMVGVLAACISKPAARARYFLSFAAAWLLIGVIGAYALSSAGPCYAGRLGTANASWFRPLMQHLASDYDGLNALTWQDVLWKAYAAREYGFARGISAAPSMHNAICMLYVLAAARSHALLSAAAVSFAAIIYIGSIHLGWHYAVDGLLAYAAMIAIWSAVGRYLEWCGYGQTEGIPETDAEDAQQEKPIAI